MLSQEILHSHSMWILVLHLRLRSKIGSIQIISSIQLPGRFPELLPDMGYILTTFIHWRVHLLMIGIYIKLPSTKKSRTIQPNTFEWILRYPARPCPCPRNPTFGISGKQWHRGWSILCAYVCAYVCVCVCEWFHTSPLLMKEILHRLRYMKKEIRYSPCRLVSPLDISTILHSVRSSWLRISLRQFPQVFKIFKAKALLWLP